MPLQPAPSKLSPELLQALRGIKTVRQFPKGALLFQQGFPVKGVYLVESGEVRILLPTGQRQKQLLEVAGPGALLGLSDSMSGENYRVTAEAGAQTIAGFNPRQDFLELLRAHGDFCARTCTGFTTNSAVSAPTPGARGIGTWMNSSMKAGKSEKQEMPGDGKSKPRGQRLPTDSCALFLAAAFPAPAPFPAPAFPIACFF